MLTSRLPQIAAAIPRIVETAVDLGVERIAASAKQRAPDAPPFGEGLVDAIHVEPTDGGAYVIAGDDDVFYGHMVEHGTSHSAPHPFLVPAFEENVGNIVGTIRNGLRGV